MLSVSSSEESQPQYCFARKVYQILSTKFKTSKVYIAFLLVRILCIANDEEILDRMYVTGGSGYLTEYLTI